MADAVPDLDASNAPGQDRPRVAAVVPHWNRRDLLQQLLDNLPLQTRPFDQIIVADNGSTDGSAELAESRGVTVLRLGRNLGFAAAVNQGIQAAVAADYVAILNNDVTLDPLWLQALLAAVEGRDESGRLYGFATGKILSARDHARGIATIDGTWDEISRAACPLRCGAGKPDTREAPWNRPRRIRMASMTALLLRTQLFREVGYLDEEFGSYLEDVDFGLRCALAGYQGVYHPEAKSYHLGSSTLGRWNPDSVRLQARNQILLAAKHFRGMPGGFRVAARLLWGQGLWGLVALKQGCGLAYLQGKFDGWSVTRPLRRSGAVAGAERGKRLAAIVTASERTIFEMQQQTGFDLYWKFYFWPGAPGNRASSQNEGEDSA